jgi:hypothetical protein
VGSLFVTVTDVGVITGLVIVFVLHAAVLQPGVFTLVKVAALAMVEPSPSPASTLAWNPKFANVADAGTAEKVQVTVFPVVFVPVATAQLGVDVAVSPAGQVAEPATYVAPTGIGSVRENVPDVVWPELVTENW